jgi:hypothetical protein
MLITKLFHRARPTISAKPHKCPRSDTPTTSSKPTKPWSRLWKQPGFYLGVTIFFLLVLGSQLVSDYGMTWDEPGRIDYAQRSIATYTGATVNLEDEKGPSFGMVQWIGAKILQKVLAIQVFATAWHFVIFFSYLLGMVFFYCLCRRWIDGFPALAATLVFFSQPLIWGHSFMNPKDLPFMVFFLGSITTGLGMADHFFPEGHEASNNAPPSSLKKRLLHFFFNPYVWAAGGVLGFTNDIRSIGPAAGALIVAYLLIKGRKKALPIILWYLAIAALVTYIFWPYLWGSPIANYLKSFSMAADFDWRSTILFGGKLYLPDTLPASYIPTVISIQYTEPALLLFTGGMILAIRELIRRPSRRADIALLLLWFVVPIGFAILNHSTVYDNARQFLFAIPPLFVIGGLALQFIWAKLQKKVAWFMSLAVLLILPAVYWNIHLHPYEYIYYNSLAGGVSGAFRNYETDYWGLSYKEDIEYVNQVAESNSVIYVYGSRVVSDLVRPDLHLDYALEGQTDVDYAVILTKRNIDERIFPDSEVIYQTRRDNSVLSVVKKISPGDDPGNNDSHYIP